MLPAADTDVVGARLCAALPFFFLLFFLAAGFARDSGSPAKKKKKNLETPKRRRESLFTLLCVFKKLQRVKQARRVSLPATLYGDGSVFIVFSSLTSTHPAAA